MIIIGCLSLMIFTSCGSHNQKTDEAFERVKKERLLSKDSITIKEALKQEPMNIGLVKNNENLDVWTQFKIETEKKIRSNENIIKEIKKLPNANPNLLRKVTSLEKTNNDLRRKMDEYNEDEKVKWEKFKTMMNHDVNEIGIELKAIKITHKK